MGQGSLEIEPLIAQPNTASANIQAAQTQQRPDRRPARIFGELFINRAARTGGPMILAAHFSRLGHTEMASIALIWSVYPFVIALSNSSLYGMGILLRIMRGENKEKKGEHSSKKLGAYMQQGILLAILQSILSMPLMYLSPYIFTFLSQNEAVIETTKPFFHLATLTVPAAAILTALNMFAAGTDNTYILAVSAISGFITLLSSYFLLLQAQNINKSSALALAYIAREWSSLALTLCLLRRQQFKKYDLFSKRLSGHYHMLKDIWRIGWPITVNYLSEFFYIACLSLIIGAISKSMLAAFTAISLYQQIVNIFAYTAASTERQLLSQANGAGDFKALKKITLTAMAATLMASMLGTFFLWLGKEKYIKLLTETHKEEGKETVKLIQENLIFFAMSYWPDIPRLLGGASISSMRNTRFNAYMSVICVLTLGLSLNANYAQQGLGSIMSINSSAYMLNNLALLFGWVHQLSINKNPEKARDSYSNDNGGCLKHLFYNRSFGFFNIPEKNSGQKAQITEDAEKSSGCLSENPRSWWRSFLGPCIEPAPDSIVNQLGCCTA